MRGTFFYLSTRSPNNSKNSKSLVCVDLGMMDKGQWKDKTHVLDILEQKHIGLQWYCKLAYEENRGTYFRKYKQLLLKDHFCSLLNSELQCSL